MSGTPIWTPDPRVAARSRIAGFTAFAAERTGTPFPDYRSLWQWSVDDLAGFWSAVYDFFDLRSSTPHTAIVDDAPMPGTRWLPGARLNYAEHALRHGADDAVALIAEREDGTVTEVTWGELRRAVGAFAAWLRGQGVGPGDRVVGYLANTEHAIIAFLGAASVGAVWSACGQDYGASGAAARFAQLDPVVLVAADGYRWNGKEYDRRSEVAELAAGLPNLRATVHVPVLGLPRPDDGVAYEDTIAGDAEPEFAQLDADAPLWVLFSSGTTGAPKGIVHGHGGVVLDHHRLLGLHLDLSEGDRMLWYTTPNWMMWNLVASGLLLGATVVLYDGAPAHPTPARLWAAAARHRVNVLGVSPGYLQACARAGLTPGRDLDLSALRTLGCTGAPLPAASYPWVRDAVGPHVQVASTSGGTDIVSGFAGGAPTLPVYAGEISAPLLGVALAAWDGEGKPVTGEVGELVVTRPLPSMPLYFWNDPEGTRYKDAYFGWWPGVWRHGDWVTVTSNGGLVISGRSDATLNRQGVRLGSADIYAVVDALPSVAESLVVGVELAEGGYWMPLFVVMADGYELTDDVRKEIVQELRTRASPRHVPDEIIAVPVLPHTRTGKKLEIPVKRLLQGARLDDVAGREAVDDPAALAQFTGFARTGKEDA
ncbi:acetoacetate--CoA ligase [Actinocorallia sp. A-T 12471]|uniref:acetoacetate--CoA ligase n=1 Tax=Actinocorallia sp. A-T 12471 TaxID=3089813 RepID=UPI0029CC3AF9|nr:acetoacetate--CoA ligase [Actinocorallia sp. A-T 12471]MDX6743957.1 acetoacetate--CoA ligase [Actinocorallia sp. A-T 12471]